MNATADQLKGDKLTRVELISFYSYLEKTTQRPRLKHAQVVVIEASVSDEHVVIAVGRATVERRVAATKDHNIWSIDEVILLEVGSEQLINSILNHEISLAPRVLLVPQQAHVLLVVLQLAHVLAHLVVRGQARLMQEGPALGAAPLRNWEGPPALRTSGRRRLRGDAQTLHGYLRLSVILWTPATAVGAGCGPTTAAEECAWSAEDSPARANLAANDPVTGCAD